MKWDGKKISRAGLYEKLPIEEYHRQCTVGASISSSGLRTIYTESPEHFWDQFELNPDAVKKQSTKAMLLGRASHFLLLGEEAFYTQFIVRPDKWADWRTDAAKAWRDEQEAEGRTVLVPENLIQIRGMAKALAKHPLVQQGILNGKIEQSLIWQDKKTGVWLKSRPDAIPVDGEDLADLKGTSHVGFHLDDEIFRNRRYDLQAALAKWGCKEVLGLELKSFSFVFCAFDRPHSVDVISLQPADIAEAEEDLRVAVDTFAYCLATNDWFGPSGSQNDARWAVKSEYTRKSHEFRRDFLRREIAKGAT